MGSRLREGVRAVANGGGARGPQFSQWGGRDLERVATSSFQVGPVGGERGGRGTKGETTERTAAREPPVRARSLRTCAWILCLMTRAFESPG